MPSCRRPCIVLPLASPTTPDSRHRAIALPATPPVLNELIRVHRAFIKRKAEEQQADYTRWLIDTADQVDRAKSRRLQWLAESADQVDSALSRRTLEQAEYTKWLIRESLAIDWKNDPIIDLN